MPTKKTREKLVKVTSKYKSDHIRTRITTEELQRYVAFALTGQYKDNEAQLLEDIGDRIMYAADVLAMIKGVYQFEDKYLAGVARENSVMQQIMQDKLGVTNEDIHKAKAKVDADIKKATDSYDAKQAEADVLEAQEKAEATKQTME